MTLRLSDDFLAALTREERAALRAELDAADLRDALAEALASVGVAEWAPAQAPTRLTYTVAEAAEYLQCSTDQVYDLIHAGELPAARIGKSFAIRARSLEQYLVAREGDAIAARAHRTHNKRGRAQTADAGKAPAASAR